MNEANQNRVEKPHAPLASARANFKSNHLKKIKLCGVTLRCETSIRLLNFCGTHFKCLNFGGKFAAVPNFL